VLESARGNYPEAIAAFEEARSAFESIGEGRGVALQEYHLGRTLDLAGRHREAARYLIRAKERVDPSDELTLARVLLRLGQACRSLGDRGQAKAALEGAVELMHRNDASFYEATAREALAQLASAEGDGPAAVGHLRLALAIYTALNSPRAERVRASLTELEAGA
jgi:tetratricopeptide (TPR) repeat protein